MAGTEGEGIGTGKDGSMKFTELRKINVNEHVEKKNGLSYLSWVWAVDQLMQLDENANWEYSEPKQYGETLMVFCTVEAFGRKRTAQLPVMDYKNKAVPNPDAFQVNTAMQRCLAKAISLHGIGLYIYAGEDLPPDEDEAERLKKIQDSLKAINKDNLISRQHDAWVAMKPLFKDESEEASAWSSLDATTRRHIKEHGQALRDNPVQEEVPISQLIAA